MRDSAQAHDVRFNSDDGRTLVFGSIEASLISGSIACRLPSEGKARHESGQRVRGAAEVRRSADQMTVVAGEASSSRAAVADSVSTQTTAWKQQGGPGFTKFVDILESQAERLRTDLTDLGDKLCAAAAVYEQQDHEAGGALDSAVRYD